MQLEVSMKKETKMKQRLDGYRKKIEKKLKNRKENK